MQKMVAAGQQWVREYGVIALIVLVGVLVRTIAFGSIPNGLNQDEAYAGYEAFSLLNYGIDSNGYHNPVYFVSWGSGMNVLESYLMIPFIALFGCNEVVIRLPQLCVALLAFPYLYLILKKLYSKNIAIIGLALLAIVPWHIMLSRWGLESNLAPTLQLIGFYYIIKGVDTPRYFLGAAIAYGLALYCYAIYWMFIPVFVLLACVYWVVQRLRSNHPFTKETLLWIGVSVIVLLIFALPLILFLLVNNHVLEPIYTPFFSVPLLTFMRSDETSFANFINLEHIKSIFSYLLGFPDTRLGNGLPSFGILYYLTTPFFVIGLYTNGKAFIQSLKTKTVAFESFVVLQFLAALLVALSIKDANINQTNYLYYTLIILAASGIGFVLKKLSQPRFWAMGIGAAYFILFGAFCTYYFTDYNKDVAAQFDYDAGGAIQWAKEYEPDKQVYLDIAIEYPQVLFFDKTSPYEFLQTVKWREGVWRYRQAESFKNYHFKLDSRTVSHENVYIARQEYKDFFIEAGFTIIDYGSFFVANAQTA